MLTPKRWKVPCATWILLFLAWFNTGYGTLKLRTTNSLLPSGAQSLSEGTVGISEVAERTDTGFFYPLGKKNFVPSVGGTWLGRDAAHGGHYLTNRYHLGVDMLAPNNNNEETPVYAISDGTVALPPSLNGWGDGNVALAIKHTLADGSAFLAVYGHIKTSLQLGEQVSGGTVIGHVGHFDLGDHLHFGVHPDTSGIRFREEKKVNGKPRLDAFGNNIAIGWGLANEFYWPDTNGFEDPVSWITTKSPAGSTSSCGNGSSESFRLNGGPPVHPDGSLINKQGEASVYVLQSGEKRLIPTPERLRDLYDNGGFDFKDVITISEDELNRYVTGAPVTSRLSGNGRSEPDGRLIRARNGTEVSIVTNNGGRRPFFPEATFLGLGYLSCNVKEVDDYGMYMPVGAIVDGNGDTARPDDFKISVEPPVQNIPAGETASFTVVSTTTSGSPQPILLTSSGLPPSSHGTFGEMNILSGARTTFSVATSALTTPGNYTLTVTASGLINHSIPVPLTVSPPGQERLVLTSSLKLSPVGPYLAGDVLTAEFTITNKGNGTAKVGSLLVGGRLNNESVCNGACPDFTDAGPSLKIRPGATYNYIGTQRMVQAGNYTFFVAFRLQDGNWVTNVQTDPGVSNSVSVPVISLTDFVPEIRTIEPGNPIATKENQVIRVHGNNFQDGLSVRVSVPGEGVKTIGSADLKEVTPSSFVISFNFNGIPGIYSMGVLNRDLRQSTPFFFDVLPAASRVPRISRLRPPSVVGRVFELTAEGSEFDASGAVLEIYDPSGRKLQNGVVLHRTETEITASESFPGSSPGTYGVRVLNPDGQRSLAISLSLASEIQVSPGSAPAGTRFEYKGQGFTGNGLVITHVRPLDGMEAPTRQGTADKDGSFTTTIDSAALTNGHYEVWAVDGVTGIASNKVSLTIEAVTPPPPTINPASSVTASGATLSWSSATEATDYRVQVSTSQAFSTSADGRECFNCISGGNQVIAAPTTSLSLGGLSPGTTYFWRVRAGRFMTVSVWTTNWSSTGSFKTDSAPQKLSVTLTASRSSGSAPFTTTLTATTSGTATGTINYTFYRNRSDGGTDITLPADGKFDGVTASSFSTAFTYTTPGTYTAKVIVEQGNAPPAEARVSITVTENNQLPDLVVSSLSVSSASGAAGSSVTVSFTIRNRGTGTAGASTTNIRLSTSSSSVTGNDPLLATISTASIAASGTTTVSQPVTIPAGTSSGAHFIWVILDVNSTAGQGSANEANDKSSTAFTVIAPLVPDLITQNLAVSPTSGAAGSSATVSFTIRNQGTGTAGASTTNIRLSTSSSSVTGNDPLLATISTASIAASSTTTVSQPVTIPAGTASGAHFIWVILDVNSTAGQGPANEANDKSNTPFTVSAPQMNLPPPVLTAPQNGVGNQSTTPNFSWTAVPGASSYRIMVSSNQSALPRNADADSCSGCVINETTPGTFFTPTIALSAGTTYFWQVKGRSVSQFGEWSAQSSFTTAAAASNLPAPTLSSPPGGSGNQLTTPTFTWSAVAGASSYRIMVSASQSALPRNADADSCSGCVINETPSGTALTPSVALNGGTTYFWQVKGRGVSQLGEWSAQSSFTTASGGPSLLVVRPTSLVFEPSEGSSGAAQSLEITSGGSAPLNWKATPTTDDGRFWLTTTFATGTTPSSLTAVVNTTGLLAGSYTGKITITSEQASNSSVIVPVTLRVSGPPRLLVSPESLQFSPPEGTITESRQLNISSSGQAFSWTGTVVTNGGSPWLSISPAGQSTPSSVTVTVNTTGLVPGDYSGKVTISAPETIDREKVVTVNLTVNGLRPPAVPASPNPKDRDTGVSTTPTLSWNASRATSYDVFFGTTEAPSLVASNQPAATYTPGTLQFGTTYFWEVLAKNATGSVSGPLWRFTTQGGVGTITVNATLDGNPWPGPVSYGSDFGETQPVPSVSGTEVPKTFSGQQAGVYHFFYNSGGPAGALFDGWLPGDRQTLTPGGAVTYTMLFRTGLQPPAAPSNLKATAVSASQVNLSWTDNSNNEASFVIERRKGSESFTLVQKVGKDVTTAEDKNLIGLTTYTYRVKAVNAAGDSAYSSEATATTPGDPPTILLQNNIRTLGATVVGQTTEVSNFGVLNRGDAPLIITSITRVSGSAEFSVPSPAMPATIGARSFVNLTLKFAPTGTIGWRNATFRITSNDTKTPTVDFLVEGFGKAP